MSVVRIAAPVEVTSPSFTEVIRSGSLYSCTMFRTAGTGTGGRRGLGLRLDKDTEGLDLKTFYRRADECLYKDVSIGVQVQQSSHGHVPRRSRTRILGIVSDLCPILSERAVSYLAILLIWVAR